jgi:hypothetical protein
MIEEDKKIKLERSRVNTKGKLILKCKGGWIIFFDPKPKHTKQSKINFFKN